MCLRVCDLYHVVGAVCCGFAFIGFFMKKETIVLGSVYIALFVLFLIGVDREHVVRWESNSR